MASISSRVENLVEGGVDCFVVFFNLILLIVSVIILEFRFMTFIKHLHSLFHRKSGYDQWKKKAHKLKAPATTGTDSC